LLITNIDALETFYASALYELCIVFGKWVFRDALCSCFASISCLSQGRRCSS